MDAVLLTLLIGALVRVVVPFGLLLLAGTLLQRSAERRKA